MPEAVLRLEEVQIVERIQASRFLDNDSVLRTGGGASSDEAGGDKKC